MSDAACIGQFHRRYLPARRRSRSEHLRRVYAVRTGPRARLREPLNKSRVAATEAFRDEMREATRRPWQAPRASGATKQIARKTPSLRVSAQWHSSALLRSLRIR